MIEFIGSLIVMLYQTTLDKYPGMTIIISLLFLLIGGMYYFIFCKLPDRTYLMLTPFVVKEQMDSADEYLDEIENDMLSIYLRMRKDAKNGCTTGLIMDEETKRFQVLSKFLLHKTKSLVRYFFRENHLAEMSEADFNRHISDRADLIMRRLREMYNMWYISGESPTAEEFYETFLTDYKLRMKNKLQELFREGREIAKQFQDKKFKKKYVKNL
jgi:hypothetical protein